MDEFPWPPSEAECEEEKELIQALISYALFPALYTFTDREDGQTKISMGHCIEVYICLTGCCLSFYAIKSVL